MKLSKTRKGKCLFCQASIDNPSSWEFFCSDRCKRSFPSFQKLYCFYCGEKGKEFLTVEHRVCPECKPIINSISACCSSEEASNIIDFYEKKYIIKLSRVEWNEEDLEELGISLKTEIQKGLKEKSLLEDRMLWLRYVSSHHTCQ